MKRLPFLLLLLLGFNIIYAQNDSIEKKVLYNRCTSNQISLDEFSKLGSRWNQTIKNINGYPSIPFNNEGKIEYSFVEEFNSLDKSTLYNRILEWFSITYGIIPAYMYANASDGKIISTQSFNISNNEKCTYCYVIAIKNEKIKLNVINIDYEVKNGGYYSGDTWIPETSNTTSLDQFFPIILKKPAEWISSFKTLQSIDNHFKDDVNSIRQYILTYNVRYSF
jgi:hypothetical protein